MHFYTPHVQSVGGGSYIPQELNHPQPPLVKESHAFLITGFEWVKMFSMRNIYSELCSNVKFPLSSSYCMLNISWMRGGELSIV